MRFEVDAPMDLGRGYPLEVEINGKIVTVPVPYNVKAGELIIFDFVDSPSREAPLEPSRGQRASNVAEEKDLAVVPHGQWRNGLCDCWSLCCVSPLWWNAYCFPCIVWAQLLTRMKLDPLANPGGSPACVSKTFFIVVGLFCFVGFLVFLFFIIMLTAGFSLGVLIPFFLIFIAFSVYFWVLLIRLRGNMRHQFEIPGSCCGDFCTIYCCGICSTIQMARHTHDEKDYKYQCCNTTGLPPDAPQVV